MNDMDAFPTFGVINDNGTPIYFRQKGMSLRDYFAGQAIIGYQFRQGEYKETYAKSCYELADAMLKAREVNNEK